MISAKSFKTNLKKYKITTYTADVLTVANGMLMKFIDMKVARCTKPPTKTKKSKKGQKGGDDYSQPSEYYGVESGSYSEFNNSPLDTQSTDATSEFIRPALDIEVVQQIMDGGAGKFALAKSALEAAIKKANKAGIKIGKTTKGEWQREFQNLMDEILKKVAKKNGNFYEVIKQKKYSKYV